MYLPKPVILATIFTFSLGGVLLLACNTTADAVCLPAGPCECVTPDDCGVAPPCYGYACFDVCQLYPLGPQRTCEGGVCDGAGKCVACTSDADCGGGYCEDNACHRCDDGKQSGSEEGVDCGGRCKQCPGAACAKISDCSTGFCSDDICCTEPCANVCERCGDDGVCRPIEQYKYDFVECYVNDGHACNGQGQCALVNGMTCKKDADCASLKCKGNPLKCVGP
jgi:hypothetical protein